MNVKSFREPKTKLWHNFDKDIRLFHGTSSHFISSIVSNGLISSGETLDARVIRGIRSFGIEPDEKLLKVCREAGKVWNENGEIFLAWCFKSAIRYARHYKNGGELNDLIKFYLEKKLRRKLPDLYPNSFPVLVEVVIPTKFIDSNTIGYIKDYANYLNGRNALYMGAQGKELKFNKMIPKSRIARIMDISHLQA